MTCLWKYCSGNEGFLALKPICQHEGTLDPAEAKVWRDLSFAFSCIERVAYPLHLAARPYLSFSFAGQRGMLQIGLRIS